MNTKKQIMTLLVSVCILYCFLFRGSGDLQAQMWKQWLDKDHPSFQEIREAFYKHWKDKKTRRGSWKQFKRWEWFARNRLDEHGYFDPTLNWKGWLEKKERFGNRLSLPAEYTTTWSQIGPLTIPQSNYRYGHGGMGRINCIAFHPANPDIMWVGAPSGGLWKTTDGGASWFNITDQLPNLGVSSILVHPQNPDIIYMATGDGDGWDTFSIGILKSSDGGNTWDVIGLGNDVAAKWRINKLLMHPSDANTLLAASSSGIFKTTTAGEIWETKSSARYFKDIEVNPANPTIWYASASYNGIYKSTDTGENWTQLTNGLPDSGFARIAVAISRSSPSTIYALYVDRNTGGFYGFYRSINSGATWHLRSNTPNLLGWDVNGDDVDEGGQGNYDLTLDVDPANPNIVYLGGVNLWKSYDGGTSWQIIAHWWGAQGTPFVHADHHAFVFHPDNNNIIFSGNDGGVFKSTHRGASWEDLSSGLAIHQIYRMGQSSTDPDLMIIGTQDNGTDVYKTGQWINVFGADGMECVIDPENNLTMYCSIYYGYFYRSMDGGRNWERISHIFDEDGAWITPFAIDPNVTTTLYAATDRVYKSTFQGSSWQAISGKLTDELLTSMAIAATDPNYIYVSTTANAMFRTSDGGANWVQVGLPTADDSTTWLTVDPHTPTTLWRANGGYFPGQKVFRSGDGGDTWENLSGVLPNIPVNCVTIDPVSGGVYIGTDLGVFFSPGADANWIPFDNGLPNVIVTELEIHLKARKIRAATYGRGLWESPLAEIPAIYPPNSASAKRQRNKSLMMKEYMDVLTWEANPKNELDKAAKYRIYKLVDKNLGQIAEVDANTYEYWVRKVENLDTTYYISTINKEGKESTRVYAFIKGPS